MKVFTKIFSKQNLKNISLPLLLKNNSTFINFNLKEFARKVGRS